MIHAAAARRRCPVLFAALLLPLRLFGSPFPVPVEKDFVLRHFRFASGETLPELKIHYRTIGAPRRDSRGRVANAVLELHGTTGSGAQFVTENFAGVLFGAGGLLDADRWYLILPDGIGHGKSSKPSDGLRGRFPRYVYDDMVNAQQRLLTEGLGVDHLRLVMGTSMGGMHTWIWGERESVGSRKAGPGNWAGSPRAAKESFLSDGRPNMALQRTRRPRIRSGRSLRSLGSPLNAPSLGRSVEV